MGKKFIDLTEILWPEKGSTEFKHRIITVSVDKIKYFGESKLQLSAPLEIACKIYRGEIPKEYYREVANEMCTTIYFTDDSEVNVKETRQEINKILEMPSDWEEIKLMADEYQKSLNIGKAFYHSFDSSPKEKNAAISIFGDIVKEPIKEKL